MRECFSEHEARARNESERWDAVLGSVREYTFNSSTRSTIDRSGLGEGEKHFCVAPPPPLKDLRFSADVRTR